MQERGRKMSVINKKSYMENKRNQNKVRRKTGETARADKEGTLRKVNSSF